MITEKLEWKGFYWPKIKVKKFGDPSQKGPHVPVGTVVRDAAAQLMREDETRLAPLTADDIEKLHADQVAFSEMVFGVPASLFEYIKLCKSDKEIWETPQDLIEGSENMKDKRHTLVVNEFDTFTTTPGESVASALWYCVKQHDCSWDYPNSLGVQSKIHK